jgi:hypothetical protein
MSSITQLLLLGAVGYGVYIMINKSPAGPQQKQPAPTYSNPQVNTPASSAPNQPEIRLDQFQVWPPGQFGTLGGGQFLGF